MADRAMARPCPQCDTLTTCSGAHHDEVLTGSCPYCAKPMAIDNYNIVNGQYVPVKAETEEKAPPVTRADFESSLEPQPQSEPDEEPAPEPEEESQDAGAA